MYKGQWKKSDVAMKNVKDGMVNQTALAKEASILSKLQHPNIVRFFGLCKIEGQLWMVLEFVPDGSLQHLLETQPDEFTLEDLLKM